MPNTKIINKKPWLKPLALEKSKMQRFEPNFNGLVLLGKS